MPGLGFVLGGVVTELFDPRAGFALAGGGVLVVLVAAVPLLRGADWSGTPEAASGEAVEPAQL
jgi:hypothetical protein